MEKLPLHADCLQFSRSRGDKRYSTGAEKGNWETMTNNLEDCNKVRNKLKC